MTQTLEVTRDLVAAMAEPVDVTGSVCDCGEEKHLGAEACERCGFLDGVTFRQSSDGKWQRLARPVGPFVIAALRVTARMTLRELGREIYGRDTASTRRVLLRAVQQLEASGRIRRRWVERTTEETFRMYGRQDCEGRHGFAAWGYELVGGGS